MKTVSIVMCTYNGETYLREQLDSLVGQTYPIHELIIQDDGSTDRTLDIAREYETRYPDVHIKIYRNPVQLGYSRNFFSAYQKATGDLIASCDQDDIWEPHKLSVLVESIGECRLIFHNSLLFNSQKELGKLHLKKLEEHPHPVQTLLMPRSFGHQIMFQQAVLPLLEPFGQYNLSYDYFTCTLCGSSGRIRYLDQTLVRWRRHDSATTFTGEHVSGNKIYGYYRAIRSLYCRSNRETTRKYFQLCTRIAFQEDTARKVAQYMSKGDVWHILKTCYLCLQYKKELITDKDGAIQSLRAFFIPLFFIRDYGRYILKQD